MIRLINHGPDSEKTSEIKQDAPEHYKQGLHYVLMLAPPVSILFSIYSIYSLFLLSNAWRSTDPIPNTFQTRTNK